MKISRLASTLLAGLMLMLSTLAPYANIHGREINDNMTAPVAELYESEAPVLLTADDFTYMVRNNRVYISGYKGTETKIIIPDTIGGNPVYAITSRAFGDNSSLTYVKIPATVNTVSAVAFNLCDSLITIDVDEGNTKFTSVDGVLYTKDKSTLLTFPGGRRGAFVVPSYVKKIGSYAFDHCYNLTSVNMYNGVTEIGSYAFAFCWGITSFRLSDNLEKLGAQAISHCDGIKAFHLPASLTSIGEDAVLGRMTSDGYREYYFIDGIYCVKGSYAEKYIKKLGVQYQYEYRTVTDIATGVVLYDVNNALPSGVDITVKKLSQGDLGTLFSKKRFSKMYAYDISATINGAPYTLPSNIYINLVFSELDSNTVVSATKVYYCTSVKAYEITRAPDNMLVFAKVNKLGRFAVLTNNDFSKKGDVDGDGIVTLYDAKVTLCTAIGLMTLTPAQLSAANVVSDTGITVADARKILCVAAGIDKF